MSRICYNFAPRLNLWRNEFYPMDYIYVQL